MKESISLDPSLEQEYRELLSRIYDRITDPTSESFALAVELAEDIRNKASSLAMDAGAGDRFDDAPALASIAGLVLMTSLARMSEEAIEQRTPSANE